MKLNRRYWVLIVLAVLCAGVLAWSVFTLNWMAQRHAQLAWIPPSGSPLGVREFRLDRGKLPCSLRCWGDEDALDFIQFETDRLGEDELHRIDEITRLFPEATVTAKTTAEWDAEEAKVVQERLNWFKTHPVKLEIDISDIPHFRKFSRGDPYARPSEQRRILGDETFNRVYVLPTISIEDKQKAAALFPEADILELPRDYP